jgi:hypothetical protein
MNKILVVIFLLVLGYMNNAFTQHLLLEHPKEPHKGCKYAKIAYKSDNLEICQNNAKKAYKLFRNGEGYSYSKQANKSSTIGECKYNAQKAYYRSC